MTRDGRALRVVGRTWRSLIGCSLMAAALGCSTHASEEAPSSSAYDPEPVLGLSTGALCPNEPSLRYDNFGLPFMRTYCLSCHSAALAGSARRAPPDKNFDAPAAVRAHLRVIDQQAGAGPSAVHDTMPPEAPQPTLLERQQLSTWLACGAP